MVDRRPIAIMTARFTPLLFLHRLTAPSPPQRLRAFVTHQRGRRSKRRQQIRVDIRWSRPSDPGGIIIAYNVFSGASTAAPTVWNETNLQGEQLANKFSLSDVPANTVLHFRVCVFFGEASLQDV